MKKVILLSGFWQNPGIIPVLWLYGNLLTGIRLRAHVLAELWIFQNCFEGEASKEFNQQLKVLLIIDQNISSGPAPYCPWWNASTGSREMQKKREIRSDGSKIKKEGNSRWRKQNKSAKLSFGLKSLGPVSSSLIYWQSELNPLLF